MRQPDVRSEEARGGIIIQQHPGLLQHPTDSVGPSGTESMKL